MPFPALREKERGRRGPALFFVCTRSFFGVQVFALGGHPTADMPLGLVGLQYLFDLLIEHRIEFL